MPWKHMVHCINLIRLQILSTREIVFLCRSRDEYPYHFSFIYPWINESVSVSYHSWFHLTQVELNLHFYLVRTSESAPVVFLCHDKKFHFFLLGQEFLWVSLLHQLHLNRLGRNYAYFQMFYIAERCTRKTA